MQGNVKQQANVDNFKLFPMVQRVRQRATGNEVKGVAGNKSKGLVLELENLAITEFCQIYIRCTITLCTARKKKKSFILGSINKFNRILLHKAILPKGNSLSVR